MTITKNKNGYIVISDIVKGYLVEKRYLYYTKQQAIKLFKETTK